MKQLKGSSIFLKHLEHFINTYLPETRGLSKNTMISYKTTFKLLLMFLYSKKGIQADSITYQYLTVETLSSFLEWIEKERNCSISTKNQRLAALYSFSEYAQNRDFDAASIFRAAVVKIPSKKSPKKQRIAFTAEEIRILLDMPDSGKETGIRDKVLLSLLYATGARAQEICDLTVRKICFREHGTTIDLMGKGRKTRRVRIPNPCADMLRKYLIHRKIEELPDRHVFSSQTHEYITVSCIEELFKKYVAKAKELHLDLFKETRYSPHCMRHTTAQHMLEAGVPLMVIKSFLGHASIQTTQIYAENTQATIDRNIREWNERNFSSEIYRTEETNHKPDKNIPVFLK